jgi:hypothetical protein
MATNIKTKKQVAFKASGKARSKTPNSQLFINELSSKEASMFHLEFCKATSCSEIVNHRHIYPPIDLAELETMKSIEPQDGE